MSLVEQALAKMRASVSTRPADPTPLRDTVPVAHLEPIAEDARAATATAAAAAQTLLRQRRQSHRLTVVNRQDLRVAGLLAPEEQERRTAEEYRHLKRPLLQVANAAAGSRDNVIMVGSAFSGEGKSFTSVNLALSLSLEKDWTVLMVDADVVKPQISRLFGIDSQPGLIDALSDPKLDIDSLIVDTDIPGLSILPAGQRSEHAWELLSSARMSDVIAQLASQEKARMIVFDSPPLLQTSEARVLASFMGQVILVVAANQTPQAAVLEALGLLDDDQKVKLVLNKAERGSRGDYYGGYGYSYGYRDAVARQG